MSSFFGASMWGKRRRRTSITSFVSSTESVVWVMYESGPSGSSTVSASAGDSTRTIDSGASPIVPSTSSCPAWPIRTIV